MINKGWAITDICRHPSRYPYPHFDARVNCKGAFLGLFLAGAISDNWTDECCMVSLAELEIESSVILLRTAIRDPAFLLVRFSHPAFSLSQCAARLVEGQEIEIDRKCVVVQ